MQLSIAREDLDRIIMIGDRLLIQPTKPNERTSSGLFLPPGMEETEKARTGYVIKVGPGYAIPAISEEDQPWKHSADEVRYVPIQPREGDLAVFLQNGAYEIEFDQEKYVIVAQAAVLMLLRDEALFG